MTPTLRTSDESALKDALITHGLRGGSARNLEDAKNKVRTAVVHSQQILDYAEGRGKKYIGCRTHAVALLTGNQAGCSGCGGNESCPNYEEMVLTLQ